MAVAEEAIQNQEAVTAPPLSWLRGTAAARLIGTGGLPSTIPPPPTPSRRDGSLERAVARSAEHEMHFRGCRDLTYRFFSVMLTPPPSV